MNRTATTFLALIYLLLPLAMGRGQAAGQEQKFPIVSGTVWMTCSDWNDYDLNSKIGYLKGRGEATSQIMSYFPSGSVAKDLFELPGGLTLGDYEKSLDAFCHDSRNVRVAIANAFGIVTADLAGRQGAGEEMLRSFRCVGAAGDNVAKINECLGKK